MTVIWFLSFLCTRVKLTLLNAQSIHTSPSWSALPTFIHFSLANIRYRCALCFSLLWEVRICRAHFSCSLIWGYKRRFNIAGGYFSCWCWFRRWRWLKSISKFITNIFDNFNYLLDSFDVWNNWNIASLDSILSVFLLILARALNALHLVWIVLSISKLPIVSHLFVVQITFKTDDRVRCDFKCNSLIFGQLWNSWSIYIKLYV